MLRTAKSRIALLLFVIIFIFLYYFISKPKTVQSMSDNIFNKLLKRNVTFKPNHIIVFDFVNQNKIDKLNSYINSEKRD